MPNQTISFMDFRFTEEVLGIPLTMVSNIKNTVDYWYNLDSLENINQAIKLVNKFHSYFHFEQSISYLLKAVILKSINSPEYTVFLEKSLFQDHQNGPALKMKTGENITLSDILSYPCNIKTDEDFIEFALGEKNNFAISTHRNAYNKAIDLFQDNQLLDAISSINEALEMLEYRHNLYHQHASLCYLRRANIFEGFGEHDLAKNDKIKASDLFNFL